MRNIVIIGEAWGAEEQKEQAPFIGASGYLLTKMLGEAGIRRSNCHLTNVFNLRPHMNRVTSLCGGKNDGIEGYPALATGKWVHYKYTNELDRLREELCKINPNLVICLGNTAMWAMLGRTAISKLRGATTLSTHTVTGFKVLPTYHPAAVLRQWDLRPIVVADFVKAERESAFADLRRPKREIWIEPTLKDMEDFYERFIATSDLVSIDIETTGTNITCIGFAPNASVGIVVPFYDPRRKTRSYWPSQDHERRAWEFVKRVLEGGTKKLFQNGLYDIAFLWRSMRLRVANAEHDTMLLHHALQPESLKGLGFLGSVYTDEGAWKQMRDVRTIKRDD